MYFFAYNTVKIEEINGKEERETYKINSIVNFRSITGI